MKYLAWLLVAALLIGGAVSAYSQGAGSEVAIVSAANCDEGCWRLVDVKTRDGTGRVLARAIDESGNQMAGVWWKVSWQNNASHTAGRKTTAPGLVEFPLSECVGYESFMGPDRAASDVAQGIGLADCEELDVTLTFQWQPARSAGGYTQFVYLPLTRSPGNGF